MGFANPYLVCTRCRRQVAWRRKGSNEPCGCTTSFESACPSWSPADGCGCSRLPGGAGHFRIAVDPPAVPPAATLPDWVALFRR